MLQMVNHGGHCCGVKHIFGLPSSPTGITPALTKVIVSHGASAEMSPGKRFYPGPDPQEPGGVRFDKLLVYLDKCKPQHLVEVVLTSSQKITWEDFLRERGFTLVTPDGFKNCNTSATLYVFHRTTPLSMEMKAKQDERVAAAAEAAKNDKPKTKEAKPAKPLVSRTRGIYICTCPMCVAARDGGGGGDSGLIDF
jgi:hypothetical protein